jgi:cell division protein FtsB
MTEPVTSALKEVPKKHWPLLITVVGSLALAALLVCALAITRGGELDLNGFRFIPYDTAKLKKLTDELEQAKADLNPTTSRLQQKETESPEARGKFEQLAATATHLQKEIQTLHEKLLETTNYFAGVVVATSNAIIAEIARIDEGIGVVCRPTGNGRVLVQTKTLSRDLSLDDIVEVYYLFPHGAGFGLGEKRVSRSDSFSFEMPGVVKFNKPVIAVITVKSKVGILTLRKDAQLL